MPKTTYNILGFHGGVNNSSNPRDIDEIECVELIDAEIQNKGSINTRGSFEQSSANANPGVVLANRGLFVMDADRKVSDNTEADTSLVIVYDNNSTASDRGFDIFDTAWSTNEISLDTNHPVFYVVDGNLRIGDGSLTNSGKWFGYKNTKFFSGFNGAFPRESTTNDWISENQDISTPTKGNCLISTPDAGSDSNGVNSSSSQYIGNVIDGTGDDVSDSSAINLRVGFQYRSDRTTVASGYGSVSGVTSIADNTDHYPLFGDQSIKVTGSSSSPIISKSNSLSLNEEKNILFGFFQTAAEYDKLTNVRFTYTESTSGDALTWEFSKENIEPDCWNILSMSLANATEGDASGDGLDSWQFGVTGTATLDYYFSGIVIANNPTIAGFSEGIYTFYHTYLYDESKQESLPFLFTNTDSYNINKVNVVGNSVLFNFDIYCSPYKFTECTIDVSDHQIDKSGHGLSAGDDVTFSGVTNASWVDKNTSTFFVSSQSLETNSFRISASYGTAILGTSIDFSGTDDSSGVTYYNYNLNKRISGSRLYYKKEQDDNFYLIGELDIDNVDASLQGFKWFPESNTPAYLFQNTANTAGNILGKTSLIRGISPDTANFVDTFKSLNGFDTTIASVNAKYKTAVVHGRRTYIGNIEQNGVKHSDRMIKSSINKFDSFPSNRGVVDVAIRDGESIVKLETYADRILQYKQKSLYIVNVSDNVDFLEDVYRNKGCLFDYHVTKTDFGIAWFNLFGVYFYDGRTVQNLFEKDGKLLINKSEWENFIIDPNGIDPDDTTMENAHIAYIPKKRQLFIKSRGGGVYIYDFLLRAWTTHSGAVAFTTAMSNFALNSNQELIYIYNADFQIAKWNPDSSSVSNFKYVTKDIDFGQPSVRKKVYKVYVTYKSNGDSNVSVKYDINGAGGFTNTFKDMTDSPSYFTSDKLLDTSSSFKQAVLKPTTSSVANNIYSFQLRFQKSGSNVPKRFEIDDITIVYRMKNPK